MANTACSGASFAICEWVGSLNVWVGSWGASAAELFALRITDLVIELEFDRDIERGEERRCGSEKGDCFRATERLAGDRAGPFAHFATELLPLGATRRRTLRPAGDQAMCRARYPLGDHARNRAEDAMTFVIAFRQAACSAMAAPPIPPATAPMPVPTTLPAPPSSVFPSSSIFFPAGVLIR